MAFTTALAIGSLALGAYGTYQQSRGQKEQAQTAANAADYNAKLAEQEAIQADMESRAQLAIDRRRSKSFLSQQRTQFASSGVLIDSGSPLEIMSDNAAQLELNALQADRSKRIQSRNALADATSIRMGGQAVSRGLRDQATGTLLGGVANLGAGIYNFRRSGAI